MTRVQIENLPVSVELNDQEAREIQGGLSFGTATSSSTMLASTELTTNDPSAILIGLLLPAVQKVR